MALGITPAPRATLNTFNRSINHIQTDATVIGINLTSLNPAATSQKITPARRF